MSYGNNMTCGPNDECIIPVTDFLFSDVFTARAANGFEFVGWQRRNRGLCGGSAQPCELSTEDLPRNAAIRALLGSDDEDFFLVPVFEATGGGGANFCIERCVADTDCTQAGNAVPGISCINGTC